MSILVIHDDVDTVGHLVEMLRRQECDAVVAVSRCEAFSILHDASVAILSVTSSGDKAVSAIAEIRNRSDVPLMVMTPAASSDECVEMLLAGADDCVGRSEHVDVVLARVRVLLRRRLVPVTGTASTRRSPRP
ncbi:response regulator [Pseudonocardia acaciae]|uniref:response regulator n=1 Tax=Pseudonocardia acaciae TaxID=551276 RepID=UPI0005645E59|nr:response regulator [Pseudonocardia acaciae]